MTGRRRLTVVVVGGLAAAGLLAAWLFTRASRLDREHFEALRDGMTRAEVEQLLGGPPRNECLDPVDVWVRRQGKFTSAGIDPGPVAVRFFPDAADGEEVVWLGRSGLIAARFGDDGVLRERYFSTVHGPDESVVGGAFRRLFGREGARQPRVPQAQGK